MRLFSSMLALVALSSLAGCATAVTATSRDTAVRVEPRRVSANVGEDGTVAPVILPTRRAL